VAGWVAGWLAGNEVKIMLAQLKLSLATMFPTSRTSCDGDGGRVQYKPRNIKCW
jgi:hypothetical protein